MRACIRSTAVESCVECRSAQDGEGGRECLANRAAGARARSRHLTCVLVIRLSTRRSGAQCTWSISSSRVPSSSASAKARGDDRLPLVWAGEGLKPPCPPATPWARSPPIACGGRNIV
eukprot:scaffold120694_cov35-Tisochrysis_lutea.AAC.2